MATVLTWQEHVVVPELRPHVRCLWELAGPCADFVPELLLPDGCLELVLNFGGAVDRLEGDRVVPGPRTFLLAEPRRPVTSVSTGCLALVGVRFWPGASAAFVDAPPSALVDGVFGEAALAPSLARDVSASVHGAEPADRVRELQRVLVARLRHAPTTTDLVRLSVRVLFARAGCVKIEALADAGGVSRRQLERRFEHEVGMSPKSLATVLRFRRVLQAIGERPTDWATVARQCGYSDQSHLTRDFRRFTGRPPATFVREDHPLARLGS